ncbi:HU family DNA-binding protein [Methylobacterium sp. E-046]|uniref:HU family DNA-binding protein n=1 Tax=Methylobacterium sp. E-046 TaxID=2836576 RepID=UPI001FB947E4|nr:HU family DNA-binding protein [Methylobacterium sp. E-046]MCJ2102788.1 HU family DNA-binding protein [Methylobacterium sp. E-046]
MIKSELIARITEQNPHLYAKDVEAVVGAILDRIALALVDGDRVELRDFGAFSIRDRDARAARNPRTREPVVAKAKAFIYFKPGKGMRARLNLKTTDTEQDAEQLLRAELRSAAAAWPAR